MPVVDANVALAWAFPADRTEAALELLEGREPLIAPDLIVHELTNAVWLMQKTGLVAREIGAGNLQTALSFLDRLHEGGPLAQRALEISGELGHPAYDCFYLALAEREGAPLVTADARLLRAVEGGRYAGLAEPL